ncbi:methionine ABC transporter substrate-binding protein [Corynebacterium sp. HMSC056E09]|uniref:MetQ/NlpA family ABC transporter substrate-binding protein n=1 Tax=Corynebacterium TaxID=1716 RepID=UPI0008A58F2E|nr:MULTISPECIES: MetQ/NlpA family ABC transporter substrate-binding protein [Corynebacterium]OFK60437.1 methionine ABC transporter substrate-binding protein [Corynebacterium sp. HMSC078A10]OFQ94446.1 methionine ABC transporter substrate-binding protein [Corynebacterium sp. HMSC056E09]TRX54163.1 methionine ABC transporter substrate-binding protein [Corynebacterium guaraldiae]
MSIRRVLAATSAAFIAATGLVACSSDSAESENSGEAITKDSTITIGTTDANMEEWAVFQDLAKEAGFDVKLENFADYNTPNQALDQGKLTTNKFQHLKFLAEYNKGNGTDLVPLAATEIYPLAIYWKDHKDLGDVEGQEVAIPNDSTNQGRAIGLLVQEGLVTLKEGSPLTPTPLDIDEKKSKVKVTPVDAAQTPAAYGEGKPAVINNSFLERAGIDPQSAVAQDDPDSTEAEPYINVWAVRADDADNETLHELAKLWKDQKVTDAVLKSSGDTAVAVDRSQEELQEILDRLEEQV